MTRRAATSQLLAQLVSADAGVRARALGGLDAEALADAAYVVRRLLTGDPYVAVRALAARVAGRIDTVDPAPWLIAALADRSPVVRDEAVRALAHMRAQQAIPSLAEIAGGDPVWWVRRSAIYALAVVDGPRDATRGGVNAPAPPAHRGRESPLSIDGPRDATRGGVNAPAPPAHRGRERPLSIDGPRGDAAVGPARAALGEPFWRVRHAGVQVLALLGQRMPERRAELLADVAPTSADYLRTLWGPALIADPAAAPQASRLPEPLRDRDPAVVTARLCAGAAHEPIALVELLCDPHEPLRSIAAERLAAEGDLDALAAALAWLDEPRIPHVGPTVVAMLDSLGDRARDLAERVLSAPARPGARRWAIGWVVAAHHTELYALARRCAGEASDPIARRDALPLATTDELAELIRGHDALGRAAAAELVRRPRAQIAEVVERLAGQRSPDPEIRARLIAAAAVAVPARHLALARAALDDEHPGPRAVAIDTLARAGHLSSAERARAMRDADPAVREAALDASVALDALRGDRDPFVRRAAIAAIDRAAASLSAEQRAEAAQLALGDPDPLLRARGVVLGGATLDQLIAIAGARDAVVRTAALERLVELDDRGDITALLEAAAPRPIEASESLIPDDAVIDTALPAPAAPEQRPLGTTGIAIAPLIISGAFDLAPSSLRTALDHGVDTFFWEPSYAAMTRFLRQRSRRDRARVVMGSYHADAASITADVDSALRRLRRDTLDVCLLFWARSSARLDDDAFAALDQMKRAGKLRAIGFSTHDRALAQAAIERAPWDVVMTRHSAAHPGIERALLPAAAERGTAVLGFSALCYGRMVAGPGAPSAADCYRYSLTQPGITACISAPRRHRELVENLAVLAQPTLDDAALAALRAHGSGVRAESQRFNTLIRQPTRDAAAAALALLEANLTPHEPEPMACAPEAAVRRSLDSRGRGRASLPSAMLRRGRL